MIDSKSIGVSPRRFESCHLRTIFWSWRFFPQWVLPKFFTANVKRGLLGSALSATMHSQCRKRYECSSFVLNMSSFFQLYECYDCCKYWLLFNKMHSGSRFQLSCTKLASESLSTPPATRSSSMPSMSRRSVCTSVLTSYFLQRSTPAPAAFTLFNGRATIHQAPHKIGVFRDSIIWWGIFQRKTRRRKCLSS